MSLDRRFVASLIANAFFFSTFPVRASCLAPPLSDLSFGALFHNVGSSFVQVKLITIFLHLRTSVASVASVAHWCLVSRSGLSTWLEELMNGLLKH